jgi:hypothetical protein
VRAKEEESLCDASLETKETPDHGEESVLFERFTHETVESKMPWLGHRG